MRRLLLCLVASLACRGDGSEAGGLVAHCEDAGAATADFRVDLGDWPADGNAVALDVTCEVTGARTLTCPDDHGALRPIGLEWTTEPPLAARWQVGDSVEFRLLRLLHLPDTTGWFSIRSAAGDLLLAGVTADSSNPQDRDFFAPLALTVDFDTCGDLADGECVEERPLIVAIDDGARVTHLGSGRSAELANGHRIVVERALRHVSSNPKFCPVVDTEPTYQFMIGSALD
jgi:hypothetical protein